MSDVASKWGTLVAKRGFSQIPNYLMLINRFLDEDSRLTPVEILLLIQLAGTWWKKDEKPFPSIRTLSVRCGVSERQIHRSINSLVSKKLLEKTKRRKLGIIASNSYDMQPLVEILKEIARTFPNEYPRRESKLDLNKLTGVEEEMEEEIDDEEE